ncbi:uncharacterized protein Z519_07199 [Cladophialophora bantiana CBS 173.52]|uniref:O-methyltransferase domain-containing protein n=1 Tax=Cladophialophora bantiana (strain ATCC 10958 / CBS 173.52 / CDC B-1940 / NIH 8579) TaxID=1442370 RepID=A0A0D2HN19_CLAB1|nr:uncharacterized protein Z519_07199 [Cladophialophora bantiana CBS 173.52]KIW92215.1 hypothetical protein Z519_07199 [Cladophialophora bantiana CBS 173.52]
MAPSSLPSHIDMDVISKLLQDVNEHVRAFSSGDLKTREAAIGSCRSLASALETPSEAVVRMTWVEPSHLAALRMAVDLRLFDHLAAGQGCPKSSDQIAAACSAEPWLVGRTMKHLAAMNSLRQVDADSYVPNPFAQAMTQSIFRESVVLMHDICIPINMKTAEFFAENGYTSPIDPLNTPAQHTFNAKGKTHILDIFAQRRQTQGLASMMATWMLDRPHWSDDDLGFYPVKQRLIQGATGEDDSVFLVDVGGSTGHDLEKFLVRHPFDSFPGHLVLQDRVEVIESIPENGLKSGIRATAHDFFTPQPVQGARTYFLHSIIHDYPDDRAQLILKHIARAMKKGYSKLILWDFVLPEKAVAPTLSALDWEMMSFYAASERSEGQWKTLLEDPEIGLKVNGIWNYSQFDQSVIEAELA